MKSEPRFIVDAMFGSLARWLRLLGYDTVYCDIQSDDEILEEVGDRILLTRDKELIKRARKRGMTILNPGSGSIRSMLKELHDRLGVRFTANPDESRCPSCNASLLRKHREEVQAQVPKGSLRNHDEFWQCTNPRCHQVYWQGRHWTRISNTLKQLDSGESKE
ncbi:MAG: Mut7-C RNAse domain-containing protein [Promethearchaeota archaeon]